MDLNLRALDATTINLQIKAGQLTQTVLTNKGNTGGDYDKRDMDEGWDITIKDVENIRQILIPTIHTLPNPEPVVQPYMPFSPFLNDAKVVWEKEHDYIPLQDYDVMGGVMQPLTPQIVHITSPDDDYVASATNPILDMHLKEFGVELFDIIGDDE
nr:hypothetical protein [Tanacetum cinerariifolium]